MTHKVLKEAGWKEWLEMNDLANILPHQLEMIRTAYDYGWYNAYGLESDDKRHKEMMNELKRILKKLAK